MKPAAPVKYLTAITFKDSKRLVEATAALESQYGEIDHVSPVYMFDYSNYYEDEMGSGLQKQLVSFRDLQKIEDFVKLKFFNMELEFEYSRAGKRQVNIDPAYLELAKLVVATTKNYDHRVYLGHGIYADVQLRFRNDQFVANDWTYRDYQSPVVLDFLKIVRATYFRQLKRRT